MVANALQARTQQIVIGEWKLEIKGITRILRFYDYLNDRIVEIHLQAFAKMYVADPVFCYPVAFQARMLNMRANQHLINNQLFINFRFI